MKLGSRNLTILAAILACFAPVSMSAANANSHRQELAADAGWKFFLGDPSGADEPSFSDVSWRAVDLPHDWSIESKPAKDNPSGAGGGFFPGGIGWYRKTFHAPTDWKGKRISVEFDGSTGTCWERILTATRHSRSTSRRS
jgi:beta-galactosidase